VDRFEGEKDPFGQDRLCFPFFNGMGGDVKNNQTQFVAIFQLASRAMDYADQEPLYGTVLAEIDEGVDQGGGKPKGDAFERFRKDDDFSSIRQFDIFEIVAVTLRTDDPRGVRDGVACLAAGCSQFTGPEVLIEGIKPVELGGLHGPHIHGDGI